ncbi:head-tail connector protein [Methylobacterium nodulans]|uniref:Uncharacterized phage protein (Possible DNA packaging) n=1 Tax=Methylobacterium nodulans (strain LMG 21967 / CNCM I-2342 / ORS 2060) TaxID=460265 RepID=B8IE26_METNO|nr:head-tail connector protein [Methylobacterium nodulans]ACL57572.1 uncharacterized phage protein (possible DNA packaging) [Methylobacterium nodulans ORS 2060]
MALVTLEAAKLHLRIDGTDEDALVQDKIEAATDLVLDYLKTPEHGWTAETVPARVKAAILLALGVLYENREGQVDPLTDAVRSLLHRLRDPAIA